MMLPWTLSRLKSGNVETRMRAAETLGHLQDRRALRPLVAALSDDWSSVRLVAANALKALGWQPQSDLQRGLYAVARKDWAEAVRLGAPAVEPLSRALQWEYAVRTEAAEALGKIKDGRAVGSLVTALWHPMDRDNGYKGQEAVARALTDIGSASVDPLIATLQHPEWWWRSVAAKVLGEIGDARAVTPLTVALGEDTGFVRKAAAAALGKIRDGSAGPPLLGNDREWTNHLEDLVRADDLESLRRYMPSVLTVADFTALGTHGLRTGRHSNSFRDFMNLAIRTVQSMNYRKAIPALVENLNMGCVDSAEVLDQFGWYPTTDDERKHYLYSKRAWMRLAQETDSLGFLLENLETHDFVSRREIWEGIRVIGGRAAEKALFHELHGEYCKTDSLNVRELAEKIISLGGEEAQILQELTQKMKEAGCWDIGAGRRILGLLPTAATMHAKGTDYRVEYRPEELDEFYDYEGPASANYCRVVSPEVLEIHPTGSRE